MTTPNLDPTDATNWLDAELAAGVADATRVSDTTDEDGRIRISSIVHPTGWAVSQLDHDSLADAPRRAAGHARLYDLDSFLEYVARQETGPDPIALYGNRATLEFTVVFNDHGPTGPGWGDHTATVKLSHTNDWEAVRAADSRLMSPTEMGEWLEDHGHLIIDPPAADLRDMVRGFRAMRQVEFDRAENDANGDVSLRYVETTRGESQAGSIEVPTHLTLAVEPYHGAGIQHVEAPFRWRVTGTTLSFGIRLTAVHKMFVDLFQLDGRRLADELGVPVMYGTGAAGRVVSEGWTTAGRY